MAEAATNGYVEAPELYSYLSQEQQNAIDTSLDQQRASAIDGYFGLPYGDEIVGKSQLVTRDVAEVCDYLVTSILGTLVSSDRVVQFEAKDQEQAQAADDASEAINYAFLRQQNGYQFLHDWIKLGILEKTGVAKTWVEQLYEVIEVEVPVEALEPQPDMTVGIRDENGELMPVLESEVIQEGMAGQDEFGQWTEAPTIHRAKVKRKRPPLFRDAIVLNEEFSASPDARTLDSGNYLGHQTPKSLSDLREMGYDFVDETLWSEGPDAMQLADARDADRSRQDSQNWHKGVMRKVFLREEYVFWDEDDDGIAERIKVHRVGAKILGTEKMPREGNTQFPEQPFEEWCPFPMAGRRVGQSAADKVMDIQRVRTVLLRQGMDSLYLSTNPRTLVHEGSLSENTIDDLLTPRSGALIRWTGNTPPTPWGTLPVHEQAFAGMEMMTNERESRTGVTRINQGLNPDALNKASTATGATLLAEGGEQIELYIARNFVEAFARLARKKYNLMRRHGQPFQIQVDGEYRTIDPSTWPADVDIKIMVGLGTGNQDKQVAGLQLVIESQTEAMQQGSPLVDWTKIYNSSRRLVSLLQIGNPSDFIINPNDPVAKQKIEQQEAAKAQQKSPEQIKAETEQQKTMAEMQAKAQRQQAEIQMDRETALGKLQIAQEAAHLDAQLKRDRAVEESLNASERADREYALAIQAQDRDFALKERALRLDAAAPAVENDDSNLPAYRAGGDIAQ